MKKNRKAKNKKGLIFTLLALMFCALSAALLIIASRLPVYMQERFGSPSARLSLYEQFYYSVRLIYHEKNLLNTSSTLTEPVQFTISYGEPVGQIASRLYSQGIIPHAGAFQIYLVYAGLDIGIQSGEYWIVPGLSAVQIAELIQDATPKEVTFIILPGWRAEEIAAALPTSGLTISSDAFLQVVFSPASITLPPGWESVPTLEGFLYPSSYNFLRSATLVEFLEAILGRFASEVQPELEQAFINQGLTLHEAVTLASIIEKEAVIADEQPLIASVFYNRLSTGSRLETDPTVQYALGYDTQTKSWWKNPLSLKDLSVDSPYNTYRYPGLPPGPICNPGFSALRAVAYPASTDYLFFRAACDGSGRHNFSYTFDEHVEFACED